MWNGGDTQALLDYKKKLNFMHLQAVGCINSDFLYLPGTSAIAPYEPPGETFTT